MSSLEQDLERTVPELPNFITLLNSKFPENTWIHLLHTWEAVIYSIFIAAIVCFVFYLGIRKKEMLPRGFQNVIEFFVETFQNVIVGILGPDGKKYVPFLGTLFIYILTMNLAGLVPLMKAPSSNLNITVGLALVVFFYVQYLNIKHQGLGGFLYHMAGSPQGLVGWLLVPLLLPIEIITQLTRPLTLAFRLFGNVMGEDILIGAFALFGLGLLAHINSPVGIPLQLPFMFLVLLTGTMQALVFTLLSTIYILLSAPDHS